jgi:hypothetical protein
LASIRIVLGEIQKSRGAIVRDEESAVRFGIT